MKEEISTGLKLLGVWGKVGFSLMQTEIALVDSRKRVEWMERETVGAMRSMEAKGIGLTGGQRGFIDTTDPLSRALVDEERASVKALREAGTIDTQSVPVILRRCELLLSDSEGVLEEMEAQKENLQGTTGRLWGVTEKWLESL